MKNVNEVLSNISGGKVLDVGCGVGWCVKVLKENLKDYDEIIGIDIRDDVLKKAREEFNESNIKFANIDATKMPYDNNSFDTVCISNTLHHLPKPDLILSEMERVLKTDGLFMIQEMFSDNQSDKQFSHVILHHLQGEMDMLKGVCHRETYKKQQLLDIVKNLGLEIIHIIEHNTHEDQEKEVKEEDEKEILDKIFSTLEMQAEKLEKKEQQKNYLKRIREVKDDIYKKGFFTATLILIIAKKH